MGKINNIYTQGLLLMESSIYLSFPNCSRIASWSNRSPSSFDTGLAMLLSDFHTLSLSSKVLAWAKGLRSFAFLSIFQIKNI